MKIARHSKIIDLINQYDIETQEELAAKLQEAGFAVTQATVSRDIRELKLMKAAKPGGGSRYMVMEQRDNQNSEKYKRVLQDAFLSMDMAQNILVIKTVSGMANAAGAALDSMNMSEIVGCIAGDDTIACINRTVDDTIILMEKIKNTLEQGKPARSLNFTDEEIILLKETFLLTMKPILYIANISEQQIENAAEDKYVKQVIQYAEQENAEVVPLCVKIEEELASLEEQDKQEMMEALEIKKSGLDMVIQKSYNLLGLMSFLTAGEPEVRAWTIKKGTKAPQAAGKIHTDFEKGFIRAEVVDWKILLECGSYTAAKEKGKVRSEGKDYVIKDGDVVLFRFNV